jgi:hypothetical protein
VLIKDRIGCALLQQALSCVLTHTGFMGSRKFSNVDGRWVGWHPTVLHGWHWDSVQATHGLPVEVFAWKMVLGYRWAQLDSLIVNVKGGHSWYLCGSCVSCCQVISLAKWLLIRISATPSDMGEACWMCTNVEVIHHYVIWVYGYVNYDYLIVKNDDTKNGWLSYHACLA